MKEELGGKTMTKFVRVRAETYSFLMDAVVKIKKQKTQKSMPSKENLDLKIIKIVWRQLNLRTK